MLMVIFTRATFECWKSIIDVEHNKYGWGLDVAVRTLCNASVAMSDQFVAYHTTGPGGSSGKERVYDEAGSFSQMWWYLRAKLGWRFQTQEEGMRKLIANNNAPPASVVRAPSISLLDPSYLASVEHRGGWGTIIEHAIRANVLSANNRGGQPMLVDCAERWFMWGGERSPWMGGMREPWVGMIHTTFHLPERTPLKETVHGLLQTPSFVASLPWCRLIIVFSHYLARDLRKRLRNTRVEVMRHPIGIGANDHPVQFDMSSFRARERDWQVVFLGMQYRRLSTITRLSVPYPKLWLPGRKSANKRVFLQVYKREEGVPANPNVSSFEIAYTHSHVEYDDLMLSSIVVVDVLDASANNAVLEAIGMLNPIHVTRHPAIIEYLGSSYPLFFDDLAGLQQLLNTRSELLRRTRAAHEYLRALPRDEFSLERFATELDRLVAATTAQDVH